MAPWREWMGLAWGRKVGRALQAREQHVRRTRGPEGHRGLPSARIFMRLVGRRWGYGGVVGEEQRLIGKGLAMYLETLVFS